MMPWLQQIVTGAWRPGYRSMHATCGVWRNAPGARCSFRRQDGVASIYKLLKGASRRVGDPFGLGVDVRTAVRSGQSARVGASLNTQHTAKNRGCPTSSVRRRAGGTTVRQ